MLFLRKLLFIFLGTSVDAFVHNRDPNNPLQRVPEPLRNPRLVTKLPTSLRWFYRIMPTKVRNIANQVFVCLSHATA